MIWENIRITLRTTEEYPYNLLLLADETKAAIDRYIDQCQIYLVYLNDLIIAQYAIYPTNKTTWEIKNIAIFPAYQNRGLGSYLLSQIKEQAKQAEKNCLLVGTGDYSLQQIHFYKQNGFEYAFTRTNFFTLNYPKPIIENGQTLKDMIVFSYQLK